MNGKVFSVNRTEILYYYEQLFNAKYEPNYETLQCTKLFFKKLERYF